MDKRNELLMKAKALAALEARVAVFVGWHGLWNAECDGKVLSFGNETPVAALAVAADALGIAPDLSVVVLTEDEEAIINDALCNYRDWAEKESESPYKTEEGCKYWRDTAESAESLRLRLTGGA